MSLLRKNPKLRPCPIDEQSPVNVASQRFEISEGDQTLAVFNKLCIIWLFVLFIFFCNAIISSWALQENNYTIEYRSVTSQKNKFVKLWDLVPFSSKASLEKGPCQKLPRNSNSQPKYKG